MFIYLILKFAGLWMKVAVSNRTRSLLSPFEGLHCGNCCIPYAECGTLPNPSLPAQPPTRGMVRTPGKKEKGHEEASKWTSLTHDFCISFQIIPPTTAPHPPPFFYFYFFPYILYTQICFTRETRISSKISSRPGFVIVQGWTLLDVLCWLGRRDFFHDQFGGEGY